MMGVLDDYAIVTWEVCLGHKLAFLGAVEVEDRDPSGNRFLRRVFFVA